MYDIYVCYCGERIRLFHGNICLRDAYSIIEDDHNQTVIDLKTILNKPPMAGFHDTIRERMSAGDDYEVVSTLTDEVIRRVHVVY